MISLKKIIELDYRGNNKVVTFKCNWWGVENNGMGIKLDGHGVTIVNKSYNLNTNESLFYVYFCLV